MKNLLFTSDLHFGDTHNLESRGGFDSIAEHDEAQITTWNTFVRPGDSVFIIGDLFGKSHVLPDLEAVVPKLHGTKFMVPGNHDRAWAGYRAGGVYGSNGYPRWQKWYQRYFDNGIYVLPVDRIWNIPGISVPVRLSHFPYRGAKREGGFDERYQPWMPEDDEHWLLHGHVHKAWTIKDRQVNVGVDIWGGPVHVDVINAYIHNAARQDLRIRCADCHRLAKRERLGLLTKDGVFVMDKVCDGHEI